MKIVPWIEEIVGKVYESLLSVDKSEGAQDAEDGDQEVLQAVEAARGEWERARSYFNNVTDPALIDHAIYEIEAAERKYMYLLNQAKQSP